MRRSRELKDTLDQAVVFYLLGQLTIATLLQGISATASTAGVALDKVPEHGVTGPEAWSVSEIPDFRNHSHKTRVP